MAALIQAPPGLDYTYIYVIVVAVIAWQLWEYAHARGIAQRTLRKLGMEKDADDRYTPNVEPMTWALYDIDKNISVPVVDFIPGSEDETGENWTGTFVDEDQAEWPVSNNQVDIKFHPKMFRSSNVIIKYSKAGIGTAMKRENLGLKKEKSSLMMENRNLKNKLKMKHMDVVDQAQMDTERVSSIYKSWSKFGRSPQDSDKDKTDKDPGAET
ncbi:MAG: hypothetical protein KGH62_01520 [Candidatus Micrarchaeota archaeon]|nr:hypothetical protein [Candidatus Micrarchaeota archaeon]